MVFVCIVIARIRSSCGASFVIIYILHLGKEISIMLQIEFSFYVMTVLCVSSEVHITSVGNWTEMECDCFLKA